MSVETVFVAAEEADLRLDRWFKRHYPQLGHGRLEKLLRKGSVRVDGKRAKASTRLAPGQTVRVPPLGPADDAGAPPPARPSRITAADAEMIRGCVLYRDDSVIVLNKPPGLATQGGTGTTLHVDMLCEALTFGLAEKPRLVHRLDKDTSGVLVLGRTPAATARLAAAFKSRAARKLYWALVVGLPDPVDGTIKAPIAKQAGVHGEKMEVSDDGQRASTDFAVIESVGKTVSWLRLEPRTGRTHQLRVHAAYLGTPIVGDGKYGGAEAHLQGQGVSRKLHLHARAIRLPHPDGGMLEVVAPLPRHMADSFDFFAFDLEVAGPPFDDDDDDSNGAACRTAPCRAPK
jgi:23S rRNA pseudouridine955/2504/2580 synthase